MELAEKIYLLTAKFPAEEKFGLVSQMRRSVVSIASNIAEGSGRGTDKGFVRFLTMAIGSAFELETQLLVSLRLGFGSDSDNIMVDSTNQLQKMIYNLIKRLE